MKHTLIVISARLRGAWELAAFTVLLAILLLRLIGG